uniref:Uncharacterized protein n=1 Tax=Tanacetum cinerariifolium TaxID=118510 RepID=A0A6L2K9Q1_TANCI|nr:hypothetical protein [Tanacetum cinerariifolium]
MDTLSKVSEYLNNLVDFLFDQDSLEARKVKVEKSKKELEMFEVLERKSVVVELKKHKVVVFTKEEMFDKLAFVRVDYGDYGRKTVKEILMEIHGFTFLVDFVVIGYANKGEPSVIFGRDFLVATKSKVDFGVGEMRINLIMLEEEKDIDALLGHNVNKLTPPPPPPKIKEIPPLQSKALQPVYHPLFQKPKEKVKEALDKKYKDLKESKHILEVLEYNMTYRKKLYEVMIGHARLSNNEFGEEEKMRIVENELLSHPDNGENSGM